MGVNISLVMTVLSEDRPGLVEKVSAVVADHQANWLEGHLSAVAGYFGGMIHVLVPRSEVTSLTAALRELAGEGIEITVKSGSESGAVASQREARLEVVGNDRPGIVNRISQAMASRRVNLCELETEYGSAPMSGTAIFKAHARLYLPPGLSAADLQLELERIADDLMVDIHLE